MKVPQRVWIFLTILFILSIILFISHNGILMLIGIILFIISVVLGNICFWA